jgi:hypothetical protein
VQLVPLAAEALPVISTDGREITVRIRPGIRFTPHPAFRGIARELKPAQPVDGEERMDTALRVASADRWDVRREIAEGGSIGTSPTMGVTR